MTEINAIISTKEINATISTKEINAIISTTEINAIISTTEINAIISTTVIKATFPWGSWPAWPAWTAWTDGADGADGADGQGIAVWGTTGQKLVKATDTDFDTERADLDNIVQDTKANILSSTPDVVTTGLSTDTHQVYLFDGTVRKAMPWYRQPTRGAKDIGVEQGSALDGYWLEYITNKRISNCSIGENSDPERWSIRVTNAAILDKDIAQFYINWWWKTALTGVNIQTDDTENPVDIEVTDFEPYNLSLITGNSDVTDPDWVPMVQNMKMDIGIYQTPLVISWWTF